MALNTEFVRRLKVQHHRVIRRPAGLVATQTTQGQVSISLVYNLFPNRMGRMGMPFVTTATQGGTDGGFRKA